MVLRQSFRGCLGRAGSPAAAPDEPLGHADFRLGQKSCGLGLGEVGAEPEPVLQPVPLLRRVRLSDLFVTKRDPFTASDWRSVDEIRVGRKYRSRSLATSRFARPRPTESGMKPVERSPALNPGVEPSIRTVHHRSSGHQRVQEYAGVVPFRPRAGADGGQVRSRGPETPPGDTRTPASVSALGLRLPDAVPKPKSKPLGNSGRCSPQSA